MTKTNFVDKDGWLTWMEATGGRKRARLHMDCHAYEARDAKDSDPSSVELLDEFLRTPEGLALVVSNHAYQCPSYANSWRDDRIEPALALAIVCDAAGLIQAGTKVICCTLTDRAVSVQLSYKERWTDYNTVGHTANKAAELARALIAAGVRVVCAPDEWGHSSMRVQRWIAQETKDVALSGGRYGSRGLDIPEVPVLASITEEIKKVILMRSEDRANRQRKHAVKNLRAVFRNFDAPMPRLIEALSFGLIHAGDVVPKPYKVPTWKRRLLEPSARKENEDFANTTSDRLAVAISACARIWQAAFDKYLIEPVSVKKLHSAEELDYEEILEGWQQVGTALGIEDALAAVVHDGVAIEDVLTFI